MTTVEIDQRGADVDHRLEPQYRSPAAPVEAVEAVEAFEDRSHVDDGYDDYDAEAQAADEAAWAALEEENRSLREYLKRVLAMLEARIDEAPTQRAAATDPIVEPIHLSDLDRRLRRAEETIDDLLWLVRRLAPSSTVSVD